MIILYITAFFLLTSLVASAIASRYWLKTFRLELVFKSLPTSFDGFRILHISDLHANSKKRIFPNIWSSVSDLDYDAAFITGDLVNRKIPQLLPHLPSLKVLAAKTPVYFVEGNHERDILGELKTLLQSTGITVLENENSFISRNGEQLWITGYSDYNKLKDNNFVDIKKWNGGFRVILEHQPQLFTMISDDEFLMLCGHTHGGQVRLPLLPTLFAPGQGLLPKLSQGLYENGGAKLYISSGIGTTDFPLRLFNRPEIAIITLRKK